MFGDTLTWLGFNTLIPQVPTYLDYLFVKIFFIPDADA